MLDVANEAAFSPDAEVIAAAALRAASTTLTDAWAVDTLRAIAAELESAASAPPEPNDLSHMSNEEFQALCPQGYHGL